LAGSKQVKFANQGGNGERRTALALNLQPSLSKSTEIQYRGRQTPVWPFGLSGSDVHLYRKRAAFFVLADGNRLSKDEVCLCALDNNGTSQTCSNLVAKVQ